MDGRTLVDGTIFCLVGRVLGPFPVAVSRGGAAQDSCANRRGELRDGAEEVDQRPDAEQARPASPFPPAAARQTHRAHGPSAGHLRASR